MVIVGEKPEIVEQPAPFGWDGWVNGWMGQ